MPVPYINIRKADFEDATAANINLVVRTHTDELNRLGGLNGPVEIVNNIDVGNNDVSAGSFTVGTAQVLTGTLPPNGRVAAPVGSMYLNVSGGTGTTLWIKESGGSTSSGWTAK